MTPASNPANAAVVGTAVPTALLDGGELVLLAIRPSLWLVLVESWPVLAVALLAATIATAGRSFSSALWTAVWYFCVAAGALRLVVAGFQWLGRLYVLTNRRLLWVWGLVRVEIVQCPLADIQEVAVSASRWQRMLGIGNLTFRCASSKVSPGSWLHISDPVQVQRRIQEAIGKIR